MRFTAQSPSERLTLPTNIFQNLSLWKRNSYHDSDSFWCWSMFTFGNAPLFSPFLSVHPEKWNVFGFSEEWNNVSFKKDINYYWRKYRNIFFSISIQLAHTKLDLEICLSHRGTTSFSLNINKSYAYYHIFKSREII